MSLRLYTHPACLGHDTGPGHAERPDRLRLRLHPGAWNEFIAVAEAGTVRWQDKATGLSGKDSTDDSGHTWMTRFAGFGAGGVILYSSSGNVSSVGQVATLVNVANLGSNIQQLIYGVIVLVVVALYGRRRD